MQYARVAFTALSVLSIVAASFLISAAAEDLLEKTQEKAMGLMEQGKYEEARAMLEKARDLVEKTSGPEHPDMSFVLNMLAQVHGDQENYAEAERLYRKAISILEKAPANDDSDADSLPGLEESDEDEKATEDDRKNELAGLFSNLAQLYHAQERFSEAEALLEKAIKLAEEASEKDPIQLSLIQTNLAVVYADQEKYAKAEAIYKSSLEMLESTVGTDDQLYTQMVEDLAELYRDMGKEAEAEELEKKVRGEGELPGLDDKPEEEDDLSGEDEDKSAKEDDGPGKLPDK
ncbi:tetratricopeptide repeat protein [Thermodesulfobacteriota bacterium]